MSREKFEFENATRTQFYLHLSDKKNLFSLILDRLGSFWSKKDLKCSIVSHILLNRVSTSSISSLRYLTELFNIFNQITNSS